MSHNHTDEFIIESSKELPESEVEIRAHVPEKAFATFRKQALEKISRDASMSGFRKGHVPENIIIEKIGEATILEEGAELALSHVVPHIILDQKLHYVGRPKITITKLAKDNPLGFTIVIPVLPKFKLPEYQKIASAENKKEKTAIEVTEKELDETISAILKQSLPKSDTMKKENETLPELTDALVKTFGPFKDVTDFKNRIKENLSKEKGSREKEKGRLALVETLVSNTEIVVPKVLVESQLETMEKQFTNDLIRLGIPFEKYLERTKRTKEEIKKEWEGEALKQVKLELILQEIFRAEKFVLSEKEINENISHLNEHHKDADPENLKLYVERVMTHEKVFDFLESQK